MEEKYKILINLLIVIIVIFFLFGTSCGISFPISGK